MSQLDEEALSMLSCVVQCQNVESFLLSLTMRSVVL